MTTVANGLIGGLVVALVATGAARLVGDESSAVPTVVERVLGDRAPTARYAGIGLRLVYGSVAGGTLVALDSFLFDILGVPSSTGEALAVAVVWSAALLVTVVAVRRLVLVRPVDRTVLDDIVAYHLVYGIGLGVWIRLTWIT